MDPVRRSLLGGIAGTALMSQIPRGSHSILKDETPTPTPDSTVTQLNVIFHGPCIFVIYRDRVEVLMPAADGHAWGAGNWKTEYAFSAGVYNVIGIPDQGVPWPHLPGAKQALLVDASVTSLLVDVDPQDQNYATFILPIPEKIMPLTPLYHPKSSTDSTDKQDLGKVLFHGKHADLLTSEITSLGTAHYMKYGSTTGSAFSPQITDLDWAPEKFESIANLHIYGSPIFALRKDHPIKAFRRLIQMLSGVSLGIRQVDVRVSYPTAEIDGIPALQQCGLRDGKCEGGPVQPPVLCDTPSAFVTNASAMSVR